MPARDHVLLTDAERVMLFGIPIDPDEMARRYTLEAVDLDLINRRRLDRNRLGMALQVALLRHPGMPLAQVLQIEGNAPAPLVAFLARQLGLSSASRTMPARAFTPPVVTSSSGKGGSRPPISSRATRCLDDARSWSRY